MTLDPILDFPEAFFESGRVPPRPLEAVPDLSVAIQSAISFRSLQDAIGYVCMWEEYRRTGEVPAESCFGLAVASLLRVYGVDVTKIAKA